MDEVITILKALSDETRYKLMEMLLKHDYCVRTLAHHLDISESAVSQHLKVLRNAGLVQGMKRGYYTHYRADRDLLNEVADQLAELSKTVPIQDGCPSHSDKDCSCHKKEDREHA